MASVYYAPPLLDVMAAGLGMSRAIAVQMANQTVVQQGGAGRRAG